MQISSQNLTFKFRRDAICGIAQARNGTLALVCRQRRHRVLPANVRDLPPRIRLVFSSDSEEPQRGDQAGKHLREPRYALLCVPHPISGRANPNTKAHRLQRLLQRSQRLFQPRL